LRLNATFLANLLYTLKKPYLPLVSPCLYRILDAQADLFCGRASKRVDNALSIGL
jgi:hypothetical protein